MDEWVLVDTSVWVEHLRRTHSRLVGLLDEGRVLLHPFIIGELACGKLENRAEILSLLRAVPSAGVAGHDEIIAFIENNRLMGKGLGYVDVHLLASAMLSDVHLWTQDKPLARAATEIGIGLVPS